MPKEALNVAGMEGFLAALVLVLLLTLMLVLVLVLELVFALVIAIVISYDYFPLGDWDSGNPSSWPDIAGSRGARQSISTVETRRLANQLIRLSQAVVQLPCLSDSSCKQFWLIFPLSSWRTEVSSSRKYTTRRTDYVSMCRTSCMRYPEWLERFSLAKQDREFRVWGSRS